MKQPCQVKVIIWTKHHWMQYREDDIGKQSIFELLFSLYAKNDEYLQIRMKQEKQYEVQEVDLEPGTE